MITMLRDQAAKLTTTMITTVEALRYLNFSYKKVYKSIVKLDKNYFWQRWTSNIVSWQDEYTLKVPVKEVISVSPAVFWQGSIEKIGIKYDDTEDNYTNVVLREWDEFQIDMSRYAENQPQSDPFAIISDKSIFIFPTPDANVAGGLKMEGSRRPYDMIEETLEAGILCPPEHHDVIVLWALPSTLRQRNLQNEKNDAIVDFNAAVDEMMYLLKGRDTTVVMGEVADLSYLE